MTGNATNAEQSVRLELVMAAKRHGMPTVAVVVAPHRAGTAHRRSRGEDSSSAGQRRASTG
ncbi:hypothetical protein [Streptomyces sp. NPDC002132]|uniref:hypothetical protein n=1 Tax=unclassified Streptomyces TaxID=2593676 RepID=UPI00331AA81B